jgi:large subunit ribosomal protein L19
MGTMEAIKKLEAEQLNDDRENFSIGDTVKVHFRIIEGKTERIQIYEGLVIAFKNSGIRKTFTVRKISYGVGVERVFPIHSPRIQKVEVVRFGKVRRSKLYYIRERVGKAAKVKQRLKPRHTSAK